MHHKRLRKLFCSILTVLGVIATAASPAYAGEFTLNGSTFSSLGLSSETISGTIAKGELLTPALGLTYKCNGGELSGTLLSGGEAHLNVLLSGCIVEGNKFCAIFSTQANMENGTGAGLIAASGSGQVVLMNGEHYFLTFGFGEGKESNKMTLYFSSKGCTLPLNQTLFGAMVFALPQALSQLVSQTVNTIPQAELESLFPGHILRYAIYPEWLDGGSTSVSLSGINKGQKWGAQ